MKGKEREPGKREFQLPVIDEPNALNDKYICIFVFKDSKSVSWISN